jgi:hypothetical protein
MGFLIFILLALLFTIINFVLSCFCCKIIYYIIDTIIIGLFFTYGSINSWDLHSFVSFISNLSFYYIFFRGGIVLFIFIKNKIFVINVKKIDGDKISLKNTLVYILITVNLLINIIYSFSYALQVIGASSV